MTATLCRGGLVTRKRHVQVIIWWAVLLLEDKRTRSVLFSHPIPRLSQRAGVTPAVHCEGPAPLALVL